MWVYLSVKTSLLDCITKLLEYESSGVGGEGALMINNTAPYPLTRTPYQPLKFKSKFFK